MDEKENPHKNEAASTKKFKSTQKPKWKRRVTFDRSAENMGNLIITQKVRVKKQKIKCTINFTNICQVNEKPIKSDVQKSNAPGNRIVPHCLRKVCKRAIKSKTKQRKQEKAKVKEYPIEANSSKGKKRTHTNNSEESLKSSKRFKSEDKDVSYEDISSDSLDIDEKLDSLYVDNKLETLIMKTKAWERRLSEATEATLPRPLYTSTPLREAPDDYEDIVSSSANMDVSINSQDTLILEPKLELLSPQHLNEHCVASCEQNVDPLKACSSSDFYQKYFHINENTPENLVISVDPFLASSGWEPKVKAFSPSDARQVFLEINGLSPKNTIIPKEPASCKEEYNEVSQDFLDNCVLSLKNVEEVSCITPSIQGSDDIIADNKTNVNQLFVNNKMESFPSNSKNTTNSYMLKSYSDLEVNQNNAIIMNPTNVSCSGNKSNSQTLRSMNLLCSENENNALCIIAPFKFKEPTIESVEDSSENTKADSGIDFNQNSLHEKIPIMSTIDSRKQDSDYVTADSESEVNDLDLDKSVTCKVPVVACSQISHKTPEDSLNNNIIFSNNNAVSDESAFCKNNSEEVKYNYKSGINLVEPLVVQCLNLINSLHNSPNKLEIFDERFIVNRKQVSENIKSDFGNDVNQNSVYICTNYPKVTATSEEPVIDRVDHIASSSDVRDEIPSDAVQSLLDDKSLSTKYSEKSEECVYGDLHLENIKTSNESAGNQAALEKPLLNKNAEIPVEPAVVVVYMAQNTEESIFSIDHCYKKSNVSRLENTSDEPKKQTEPSLEHNSIEPCAFGLEQNTQESPEPSLEQNYLEPTEICLEQNSRELSKPSVKHNSIETSELCLVQNSKELFEPNFERISKEPSANLKQISAEPGVGNPEKICDRSFEHDYEEPALDNNEQLASETAFANLQQNSENMTPDSISKVIQVDFEENTISHEHNVTEKFIKNVTSLKYNSKILLPAAVVITEESTVIDLTKDFEEPNTQRLMASSEQSLDGKAAGSGRNNRNIFSDNTLARDNSMPRNHAMNNRGLNPKKNKNVVVKPKCIPAGPKKPPIQNIKYKPETSSTSEHLLSLSSTNRRCTHNNPNQQYLDRAMETQISALNQALSYIYSVNRQYRPANMYEQQTYGTMYPINNMCPVPSQFNVRTNSQMYPDIGNSWTNYNYQSYAHRRNNNGYNSNRPYHNPPYRNRPYRNRSYHRPNLQAIQNTTHSTTGSIATPHARVNLESNSVKLPVKYEPNMIKQETTDYTCNADRNNITIKREIIAPPETKPFVANKNVMNDNLIRFIKKEPLD